MAFLCGGGGGGAEVCIEMTASGAELLCLAGDWRKNALSLNV